MDHHNDVQILLNVVNSLLKFVALKSGCLIGTFEIESPPGILTIYNPILHKSGRHLKV